MIILYHNLNNSIIVYNIIEIETVAIFSQLVLWKENAIVAIQNEKKKKSISQKRICLRTDTHF